MLFWIVFNAQEKKHEFNISAKNFIPLEYQIFWEGGYSEESVKKINAACKYRKIKLERTGCYGTCPIYKIEFNIDGTVEYNDIKYVDKIGKYSGEIYLLNYGKLCFLVDNYLGEYSDSDFRAHWTDDEACIITIEFKNNKEIEIYDYGRQGPIELWALQNVIDGLKDKIELEKIE
jgi:hypothetical protein